MVCGAAIWKGGRPERLAGAAFLLGWTAAAVLKELGLPGLAWAGAGIDAAYFCLLVVLALVTDRYWPIAAAGFQLLAVMTHAARLIDPQAGAWAYVAAGIIWTYLVLAALGTGVWNVARRPAEPW